MDELYSVSDQKVKNVNYINTKDNSDDDPYKQYFREFDYGIDIRDNIIVINDEIQIGLLAEFIAKTRLLKKINPNTDVNTILINSGGGDVMECLGIIDYIRTHTEIKFNIVIGIIIS